MVTHIQQPLAPTVWDFFGCWCLGLKYRKISEISESTDLTLSLQMPLHYCDINFSFNFKNSRRRKSTSEIA